MVELTRMFKSGHASKNTQFWVYANGPVTAKEVGNMIRLLQLDVDFLTEDEAVVTQIEALNHE